MSVLNNTNFSGGIVRIDHGGSTASQKLILYFDSILALKVSSAISGSAYAIAQGTGILIGRLIYSKNNYVAQLNGNTTTIIGSIKCNEMVSETGPALEIGEKVSGLIINCNFIIGTTETEAGLIFSKGTAIYLIKNAKLINNSTNSGSRGISLFLFSSSYPNLTLWNVKVVLNESSTNYIIYANNSPSTDVDVYNFGLFGNENYDVDNIDLKIGFEGSAGGFLFIEDTDLE
ncbi:MAG: hypothetical protein IPM96_13980 [Ignavibacteria bacterium]|nr:hypothetical protein [Ignavibacteria bacterium]